MDDEAGSYERSAPVEQPRWHWSKPMQLQPQHAHLSSAEARAARNMNCLFWAAMAAILLLCMHFTVTDPGVIPQPLASTAHLAVANLCSVSSSLSSPSSSYKLTVHSTVTDVDLKKGMLEMELLVQHPSGSSGSYCSGSHAHRFELGLGSTSHGAAQLVLPLCSGAAAAGTPVRAVLPIVRQSAPHPFDEHSVDVRLRLQPSRSRLAGTGRPASSIAQVEVDWHAVWAVQGLQAAVVRKLPGLQARLLMAAAGSGPDGDGGWGSSVADQPGRAAAGAPHQAEAVYSMRLTRSSWLRIMHLTAALVQVVAVGWACLLLAGQCLSAYLLQRFLCSRLHGVWS
ncbi:hypothetical protein COO60DRAFT_1626817 [Scenedesmus sp. NREL 46B-D3]|nr:hypothetical protein COO60DRAFT_1626817 [Scenedesmus sp. NREL 46B-D3]